MWNVINGNNIDILRTYEDNSFDSIVTDPPYGIEFLGKDWDKNTGAMETWQECFRVLKPGGHILAFSAARTYHHLATNIEMAGFEIRDQLMWLYGSGFPKAQDIGKAIEKRNGKTMNKPVIEQYEGSDEIIDGAFGSGHGKCSMCKKDIVEARKLAMAQQCTVEGCEWMEQYKPADNEWAGWKTALKPAHEPIVMARKPFRGSAIDNVQEWGVGALNIDASRIKVAEEEQERFQKEWDRESIGLGRYVGLDGSEILNTGGSVRDYVPEGRFPANVLGEIPEYQKYFYCPKVSRAERHAGYDTQDIPTTTGGMLDHSYDPNMKGMDWHDYKQAQHTQGNNHPTVKPVELMKYLVRLVTPAGGRVLDPFNGSGSTGMACVELGYDYTGCELDPDYVEIARNRIRAWEKRFDQPKYNLFD